MELQEAPLRAAVTILADKGALVRDRLAEFALNPEHRRSPILRLTTKGEALLGRINTAQAVWSNALAEGLRLTELDAAVQTLRTVTRRLKESP